MRFRAMGCDIVVAGATAAEGAAVRALFVEREARFSRFVERSELCCVNRATASAIWVSEPFAEAVTAALAAAARTDGLVDCTLGEALEAAGYDRDFAALQEAESMHDPVPAAATGDPTDLAAPATRGRVDEVRLTGRLLIRPPDVRLDLNGVVKSMAVDAALDLVGGDGFVSAGGDLAVRGPVDVGLPGGGSVRLHAGALATSGSTVRRWRRGREWQHHLIDPGTGRPAVSPWALVTACGASCLGADVAAKAALLAGERGPAWLDAHEIPGRFVAHDGEVVLTEAWRRSVGEEAPACI